MHKKAAWIAYFKVIFHLNFTDDGQAFKRKEEIKETDTTKIEQNTILACYLLYIYCMSMKKASDKQQRTSKSFRNRFMVLGIENNK